jgi:hypothetical protein
MFRARRKLQLGTCRPMVPQCKWASGLSTLFGIAEQRLNPHYLLPLMEVFALLEGMPLVACWVFTVTITSEHDQS